MNIVPVKATPSTWRIRLSRKIVAVIVGVLILLAGGIWLVPHFLSKPKIELTFSGLPPISYQGFQPFPTPREFDGPGTVFRKDGDVVYFVTSLPVKVDVAGKETLVSGKVNGKWNGNLLSQYTGLSSAQL